MAAKKAKKAPAKKAPAKKAPAPETTVPETAPETEPETASEPAPAPKEERASKARESAAPAADGEATRRVAQLAGALARQVLRASMTGTERPLRLLADQPEDIVRFIAVHLVDEPIRPAAAKLFSTMGHAELALIVVNFYRAYHTGYGDCETDRQKEANNG